MSTLINKILAPTDFTEFGNAAVETAAGFARAFKARLILMHVVDLPSYANVLNEGESHTPKQMAYDFAIDRLKIIQSDRLLKGLQVEICVVTGKIFRCIVDQAEQVDADLIVMGAHGLTGVEQLILGSNARRVVHQTSIPVLTVKKPLVVTGVKSIAFASNFNQEYAYSFPKIYQYVEMFDTKINLVKVITPKDFETSAYSRRTIDDFAESLNLSSYQVHIVNANSIEEGLSWFCEQEKIDLLFMPTHGQSRISGGWSGSHTERMGQKYSVPVFSVKMIDIKRPKGVIFPE